MEQRLTTSEVAAKLGVTRAAVWNKARCDGRKIVPERLGSIALWTPSQVAALRAPLTARTTRKGYYSYKQAAKALGVCTTTVRKRLGLRNIRPERWRSVCWLTPDQLAALK